MNVLLHDLHYAFRSLRKSPGFTLLAVLTLALGIGATTAIFSVVSGVVLNPLPYAEPDRLVRIWETTPEGDDFTASEPNYLDFAEQNRTFAEMAAYKQAPLSLTGDGEPERLEGMAVTHTLFPLLGQTPAFGRTFVTEEDVPGGDTRVAVLSHDLWERRFRSDPGVIGQRITLDGQGYSVVGVMGSDLAMPGELAAADLWVPLAPRANAERDDHWLSIIGRLRPGVTIEQAHADLSAIASRISQQHSHIAGWGVRLASFQDWIVGEEFRQTIYILFAAVGFLLLIACANLANLLFARATTRQAEISIRAALGAGRATIIRQLLTESALLAFIGAFVGVLGAVWAVDALQALAPASIPRLEAVAIDARVLAFTFGVALITSVLAGLAPAMGAARVDLDRILRQGHRGVSRGNKRVREVLVVSQIAMAMMLLIGAGLLIRSFLELQQVDAGFEPENLYAVPLQLPAGEYPEPWQKVVFLSEIQTRIEALPGVASVGATVVDPFSGWNLVNDVTPEHLAAESGPDGYLQAGWRATTPGFFETMKIPLVRGRLFSENDTWDGPEQVVISQSLADRLWPNDDAIGKGLFWGGIDGTPRTVIGVVGDYRDVSLEADLPPLMFLPYNQIAWPSMTVVVRMREGAAGAAAAVRREIWAVDPNLPVPQVRPLQESLENAVAGPRFRTLLLATFSTIAMLLAAIGIYGVMAFNVAQRTREIGVRLALGAAIENVSRMILWRALGLAAMGVVTGAIGAWMLTRYLESLLYDTAATDLPTFAIVSLILGGIALTAGYLPARRATRVDPMTALRTE
ncbi:MAG TPA: ABC transporter permease [Longimicrobiaceae bacterium]|nr:ABC transporter permease [Longimicrobiaceae bacterium]